MISSRKVIKLDNKSHFVYYLCLIFITTDVIYHRVDLFVKIISISKLFFFWFKQFAFSLHE